MRLYTVRYIILATVITSQGWADDNFCRKCEIMRDYHAKHPSKYEFYEDYLKDLEEKGEEAVQPRFEDLPEDVQFIIDPEKKRRLENPSESH